MSEIQPNRRTGPLGGRRHVSRDGRRANDLAGRWPTLLVADGRPELRALYLRFLEPLSFRLDTAGTADEVLSLLHWSRPAAIVLDSRLPGISPLRLAVWLARGRDAPRPPLIVLDGAGGNESTLGPKFHPQEVLQKPFHMSVMIQSIRRALRPAAPA